MAWSTAGFNFRATSGYVTDGTDETYVAGDETYPTTRALTGSGENVTFGWSVATVNEARDRNSGIDRRLAGENTDYGSGATFTVSLAAGDNGPGAVSIDIHGAFGEASNGSSHNHAIKDGATTIITINTTSGSGQWTDATNTLRTSAADWTSNEAATNRSFTGTTCVFTEDTGADNKVAHFKLIAAGGGGGGTTRGMPFGTRGTAFNGGRTLAGVIR